MCEASSTVIPIIESIGSFVSSNLSIARMNLSFGSSALEEVGGRIRREAAA